MAGLLQNLSQIKTNLQNPAGNSQLQGADYYTNLKNTSTNPQMKLAAQNWLDRNSAQTNKTSSPIGVKTANPNNNITPVPKTTPQPVTVSQQSNNSTQGGTSNIGSQIPQYKSQATPIQNQNIPNQPQQNTYQPQDNGLYGKLVTDLANRSQQSGQDYQTQQAEANKISQQIQDAKQQIAKQKSDINQSGTWTSRALGEQGQANIQNAATLEALGSQYQAATNRLSAANTQQGLLQEALKNAASQAAPVQVSPGTSLVSPTTAQEQYSGLGGLTRYGIAQQNIKQGQEYQGQAAQLDTTLKQLDTLTPVVTNFLEKSGLNSQENPFYNKSINSYTAQLRNPADIVSLNAMMADIKTYTAQVLGSSGLNPTEVSETINSFDPSLLTGQQLTSFLDNLKNLGQTRLKPLQDSAINSYGGISGYQGTPATPSINSVFSPNNSPSLANTNNPVIQGIIGGTMNTWSNIVGLARNFFD